MKLDYAELLADKGMFDIFMNLSRSAKNETISALFKSVKSGLDKQGSYNEKLHASIFIAICETVGGAQVYVPSGDYLFGLIRNFKIFKEFNGSNQKELAIKYGMSTRNITLILNYQRKTARIARDCAEQLRLKDACYIS